MCNEHNSTSHIREAVLQVGGSFARSEPQSKKEHVGTRLRPGRLVLPEGGTRVFQPRSPGALNYGDDSDDSTSGSRGGLRHHEETYIYPPRISQT